MMLHKKGRNVIPVQQSAILRLKKNTLIATGLLSCSHCWLIGDGQYMSRSCGNCFACVGCKIYSCPKLNSIYVPDF